MGALREAAATRGPDGKDGAASHELDPLRLRAARWEVLSRLSSGMAHEARNPLNAMAIHLEVLADKLRDSNGGAVPAHMEKNLQSARNQIRRLDEILRRYSEFASGRIEEPGLRAQVSRALGLCEYHARRMGAEVVVEVPEGLSTSVDGGLLGHVLVELVLLGLGIARGGGRLRIQAEEGEGFAELRVGATAGEGSEPTTAAVEGDPRLLESVVRELGGKISLHHVASRHLDCVLRLPTTKSGEKPPIA